MEWTIKKWGTEQCCNFLKYINFSFQTSRSFQNLSILKTYHYYCVLQDQNQLQGQLQLILSWLLMTLEEEIFFSWALKHLHLRYVHSLNSSDAWLISFSWYHSFNETKNLSYIQKNLYLSVHSNVIPLPFS